MVEVTGSSPVLPTTPEKPRTSSAGFFLLSCDDQGMPSAEGRNWQRLKASTPARTSRRTLASRSAAQLTNAPPTSAWKTPSVRTSSNWVAADGDFKDAEVGDEEAANAHAAGALEMVPGLPTRPAQVLGACGAVGSAVVEDFGPIGPVSLLDGHEAMGRLGRHRQCEAHPDGHQKGAK